MHISLCLTLLRITDTTHAGWTPRHKPLRCHHTHFLPCCHTPICSTRITHPFMRLASHTTLASIYTILIYLDWGRKLAQRKQRTPQQNQQRSFPHSCIPKTKLALTLSALSMQSPKKQKTKNSHLDLPKHTQGDNDSLLVTRYLLSTRTTSPSFLRNRSVLSTQAHLHSYPYKKISNG